MDHINNLLPNVSKEKMTVLYLNLFCSGFFFKIVFFILKKNKKIG